MARDLRLIVAVLKINNDLERIGDLAENIAKLSLGTELLAAAGRPKTVKVVAVDAAKAGIPVMTPTAGRRPASAAPLAMPTDAPMQTHDSTAEYGGRAPSV